MAAESAPRAGGEVFARPIQVNQRRYEALRAYLHEGAALRQAAARFGYTPAALASLVRDYRAGKLSLFAEPGKPGRKSAPKKDRARARVIQLRRAGLSVYEISARLAVEGTPLNRTGVGQILTEEGFGRLLRDPEPEQSTSPATSGRDTQLPRTARINFDAFPAHVHTSMAGLLLTIPDLVLQGLINFGVPRLAGHRPVDWSPLAASSQVTGRSVPVVLVALDLPRLVARAGYPGTSV